MKVVIIGCGYVGKRVAQQERQQGNPVQGVVRSQASARDLEQAGVDTLRMDLDSAAAEPRLALYNRAVYYFAPPPPAGVTDPRMRRLLESVDTKDRPLRIVYISTTSIYGDCHGEWVNENTPAKPQADRGKRRWDAEQALHVWSRTTGIPVCILRVPGIYGPGRLPIQRIEQGTPVVKESDAGWSNRIFVDDLVRACIAAMRRRSSGDIFNISDGSPTTMTDYFNRTADAAGLPRPPAIPMEEAMRVFSRRMISHLTESKRVDNTRMRTELGIVPAYPTVEAGMKAAISAL